MTKKGLVLTPHQKQLKAACDRRYREKHKEYIKRTKSIWMRNKEKTPEYKIYLLKRKKEILEYKRKWRNKNRNSIEYKLKQKVRKDTKSRIQPLPKEFEIHHPDYSKPWMYQILTKESHAKIHRKYK